MRNEEECVCSAPNCCNILIGGKIIKEMLGSVASGTHCVKQFASALQSYLHAHSVYSAHEYFNFEVCHPRCVV